MRPSPGEHREGTTLRPRQLAARGGELLEPVHANFSEYLSRQRMTLSLAGVENRAHDDRNVELLVRAPEGVVRCPETQE